MVALVLALDGPLQAWGVNARFIKRTTLKVPTKSGILGMLAAAEGRLREESVADLFYLRFGVRVDQVGSVLCDFQTEIDWAERELKPVNQQNFNKSAKPLTHRYYLQDYKFLAVVEGPENVIEGLDEALRNPSFPLYLGRRSCPPGRRIALGVTEDSLEQTLKHHDWIAAEWYKRRQPQKVHLAYSRDALPGEDADEMLRDNPISFDPRERKYGLRQLIHGWASLENSNGRQPSTDHDPLALLGGV